jgi:hypothetical protein
LVGRWRNYHIAKNRRHKKCDEICSFSSSPRRFCVSFGKKFGERSSSSPPKNCPAPVHSVHGRKGYFFCLCQQ